MGRKKKDGRRICYYLANDVYEELTEYAEKMGQTNTMAIERILTGFFEANRSKEQESYDSCFFSGNPIMGMVY